MENNKSRQPHHLIQGKPRGHHHHHLNNSSSNSNSNGNSNSKADTMKEKEVEDVFAIRPPEVIRVREGDTAVLRCQANKNYPKRGWYKGLLGEMFKDSQFKEVFKQIPTNSRVTFIGDLAKNDYSIEINNVIPSVDNDTYKCLAMPDSDDLENFEPHIAATRLEVIPAPSLTVPPSTVGGSNSMTTTTTIQGEHHQYSPISQHQAASLENGAAADQPFGLSSPSKPTFNNNKARDAYPGALQLDRNNQINSAGSFISPNFISNYNGQHHATVRASTAYPSVSNSNSAGSLAGAALVWPYLLLALAALLMLANIYLIFSLIRRHTRCSKDSEGSTSEPRDDDSSLA